VNVGRFRLGGRRAFVYARCFPYLTRRVAATAVVLAPGRAGGGDWAKSRAFSNESESRESEPVVKLRVRSGESIQEAVRRFRKLCERSGLRKEMRRKAYYEKPSERRRREELKRLRKARQPARV
jgi:small subunit ribosomal protein S21